MTDVIGQRERGTITYLDSHAHRKRFVGDIIGPDGISLFLDFLDEPVDPSSGEYDPRWTITRVEAGSPGESTFGPTDGVGGIGRLATDINENDGVNAQLRGESFQLAAGVELYFGIRFKLGEATQSDLFLGLAITDTDILGGVTDRIGFQKLDGSTDITFALEKDSTETLTAALATAETTGYHTAEFFLDANGTVEVFVDGVSVAMPAAENLPDDEALRVSLQLLSGAAGANTLDIDWIRVNQIGGRV